MKMRNYLKDQLPAFCMEAGCFAVIMIFMSAMRVQKEVYYVLAILCVLSIVCRSLWDYARKRKYYQSMQDALKQLDTKYLLPEMMERPSFLEGEITYDVISETGKSMYENVASYRHQADEFREYIEMWVHEVKIPLAGLLLMCHNHPSIHEKCYVQLRRIEENIENVLFYARCENAQKDYRITDTSLKRCITDMAIKYREQLQMLDVNLQIEDVDWTVLTDAKWLVFILGQFFSNSMKYFDKERKPEIRIWAREDEKKTVLFFRDNGIGIPEEELSYVFEKTYTGTNGHLHSQSTGMGLYIAKNLCNRLGHGLSVESKRGEYTQMELTFVKNDHYLTKS